MDERTPAEMARSILKPLDSQVNRQSKDSVFCDLFAKPEYLLQIYAALHPEDDVTTVSDITLVTLDHRLLNAQYNDLGFIVGNHLMVLVEHQTTWTVNILLRLLMYLGETYQRYIRNNHLNVYGTKTVSVPKPELYVIYPGERGDKPEEISLARDVFGFEPTEVSFVDVRAKIIYDGQRGDIISQYIAFCRVFDEQIRLHGKTKEAVRETIRICLESDVLKNYLAQREVEELMFGYFDMEEQLDFIRQEGRVEGRAEGIAEGENRLGDLISKLLALGRTSDIQRVTTDKAYRSKLYQEFQLT